MYTEPLTIYRELVQNAADAVDDARMAGVLHERGGRIDLTIDPLHRQVTLLDNGFGIPNDEFELRMCSIGASAKRGTKARGLRGIGRLVGLGYCQELIFRSRSNALERVFEATWDCRRLRDLLRSSQRSDLADVIASVVQISSRRATADDLNNFFQVELQKVVRLANDGLMNPGIVARYLGEVAPVPFHVTFSQGATIAERLTREAGYTTVAIHVNGSPEPITRPYRDKVPVSKTKSTCLQEPFFFEMPSQDGERGAVGWIAHHDYLGAFPRPLGVRGLRARVGNLQIGEDCCLDYVFPEQRFNQWSIGEIHVVDERIIPNGRRDDFEPNVHYENLCNHLAVYAKEIAQLCRSSSNERRRQRGFCDLEQSLKTYARLLRGSRIARIMRDELVGDVREQLDKARRKLVGGTDGKGGARDKAIARIERQLQAVSTIGPNGADSRATQRQMGQADVLRLLRERIPAGTAISVALLKMLEEDGAP